MYITKLFFYARSPIILSDTQYNFLTRTHYIFVFFNSVINKGFLLTTNYLCYTVNRYLTFIKICVQGNKVVLLTSLEYLSSTYVIKMKFAGKKYLPNKLPMIDAANFSMN